MMIRIPLRWFMQLGAGAIFLLALIVGLWWYWEVSGSGTLPNGIKYTPHTIETTRPLTVEYARKHFWGFAFPDSATNVHIAAYHEWQAAVQVVRFEAPVEDCLATARAILQKYDAEHRYTPVGDLTDELHPHRMRPSIAPLKAPWFTPESIRVGKAAVGNGEYAPEIWVDLERGVLYFHRSQ